MTKDLFAHHDWLPTVAAEDVRFLKVKDRSYGASWKLAGGRSAWFMLRRKMDRMIQMMRRPEDEISLADLDDALSGKEPEEDVTLAQFVVQQLRDAYVAEDVFDMIRMAPYGEDGTVLAEVRDLRRYLLLVEAEMMSREVVGAPEVDAHGELFPTLRGADKQRDEAWEDNRRLMTSNLDYGRRWEADQRTIADLKKAIDGHQATVQTYRERWEADQRTIAELRVSIGTTVHTVVSSVGEVITRPGTPEDGGHHERDAMFWRSALRDGLDAAPAPNGHFIVSHDPVHGKNWYNVDRRHYLRDQTDHLPVLRAAVNLVEWRNLPPEYRGMYEWSTQGEGKYVIVASAHERWTQRADED